MHGLDQRHHPVIEVRGSAGEIARRASPIGAWSLLVALAVAGLVPPTPARAAPPCGVTVSGDISFGTYDVFSSAPRDSSGRIRLSCAKGTPVRITISTGMSQSYDPRTLVSGSEALRYNLFLDSAFQSIWGDGTGGSSVYATLGGNAQLTVYARVPAGQDVPSGSYADDLTITIVL